MKVLMPQIGMTMQEGTITKWYKNDGDRIEKGELMLEITTEKLTNDIEATVSGTFKKLAEEGDIIPCGEEIADIEE